MPNREYWLEKYGEDFSDADHIDQEDVLGDDEDAMHDAQGELAEAGMYEDAAS